MNRSAIRRFGTVAVTALLFAASVAVVAYLLRGRSGHEISNSRARSAQVWIGQTKIQQVRYSSTWQGATGGLTQSTDPAGIAYHTPSGHLVVVDSEINEIPQWDGANVFELSLDMTQLFNSRDTGTDPREPTGVTYSTFDGYFYVTNDQARTIQRFSKEFSAPIASVTTSDDVENARDPEGITSDPTTGFLYVADGEGGGRQILTYDADLVYRASFEVGDTLDDPEGIAFEPTQRRLFVLSAMDIAEYTLDGTLVETFNIGAFDPTPVAPQGLVFAPSSEPHARPAAPSMYIVDGMTDNFPDGRIYEAVITR